HRERRHPLDALARGAEQQLHRRLALLRACLFVRPHGDRALLVGELDLAAEDRERRAVLVDDELPVGAAHRRERRMRAHLEAALRGLRIAPDAPAVDLEDRSGTLRGGDLDDVELAVGPEVYAAAVAKAQHHAAEIQRLHPVEVEEPLLHLRGRPGALLAGPILALANDAGDLAFDRLRERGRHDDELYRD